MKAILGPEDLVFNEKRSPIVDGTVDIINKHDFNLAQLDAWLSAQKKDVVHHYKLKYAEIVVNTEAELKKNAEKLK